MRSLPCFALALSAAGLITAAAHAEPLFGLTSNNRLVSFDSSMPASTAAPMAITGLQAGENLLGIDFRPATNQLYGLGSSGRLYTLSTTTGVATAVGASTFSVPLSGTSFGFDFNPTVDRIRVISDTGQNLRLNPITGDTVDGDPATPGIQGDGMIRFASSDRNANFTPRIVGSGYTNSVAGATSTVLYNIDAATNSLTIQGTMPGVTPAISPNLGQQFTIGSLMLDPGSIVGFDISGQPGMAYLATLMSGMSGSSLYRVDLGTGATTLVGSIGSSESYILTDIAVAVPSPAAGALLGLGSLVAFRRRRA